MGQETPGAFPLNEPYGMPARVRRQLGITAGKQKGLPGMVGTVNNGLTTSTVSGVPRGMGNKPSVMDVNKTGGVLPTPEAPKMKPFEGMKAVKPGMKITKSPMADPIKLAEMPTFDDCLGALGVTPRLVVDDLASKEASARRLHEVIALVDVLDKSADQDEKLAAVIRLAELKKEAFLGAALRAAAPLVGRLGRSKLFWGAAGTAAAGYGIGKVMKGTVDSVTNSEAMKNKNKIPNMP